MSSSRTEGAKKPELLAPAGDPEKLAVAFHYGADAAYLGLSEFSLRALPRKNFDHESLARAVESAHLLGKKIYVTLNIFPHNRDIAPMEEHARELERIGPDGALVSDPGAFEIMREHAPSVPIHVSTQANITNWRAARFWERLGARRLVLGRELALDEIRRIRDSVSVELECFVHGSLCISYSGRCYLSSFMANRSANAGLCTNSCRWNYGLVEEKRPGSFFPVYENDRGTFIMSSRDLCMIERLDLLAEAGADSFKIEGRMKGINYLGGVVKTYREAVDALVSGPYRTDARWLRELSRISNRGYTTGLYLGPQPDEDYNHDEAKITRQTHELVGVVLAVEEAPSGSAPEEAPSGSAPDAMRSPDATPSGRAPDAMRAPEEAPSGHSAVVQARVALRATLTVGDEALFLSPGLEETPFPIRSMHDESGAKLELGRNEQTVTVTAPRGVRVNDLVRREIAGSKRAPGPF